MVQGRCSDALLLGLLLGQRENGRKRAEEDTGSVTFAELEFFKFVRGQNGTEHCAIIDTDDYRCFHVAAVDARHTAQEAVGSVRKISFPGQHHIGGFDSGIENLSLNDPESLGTFNRNEGMDPQSLKCGYFDKD